MTTTPPDRTPEQRTADLQKGMAYRSARADIKRQLKAGTVGIAEILDPHRPPGDPVVGRMRIGHVVRSVPGMGRIKTQALLDGMALRPDRRVDELPASTRRNLIATLS